jgi:hypothetical protein
MANRLSRTAQRLFLKVYADALAALPVYARVDYASDAQVVAADYLDDMYATYGWPGLVRACFALARDAGRGLIVEWCRVSAAMMFASACATIVLSNFCFGNDVAGSMYWGATIGLVALALGLWLRSASPLLVATLVLLDTCAGAASVFNTHGNLQPVFEDTVRWIPLSVVLVASGSYSGAAVSRLLP